MHIKTFAIAATVALAGLATAAQAQEIVRTVVAPQAPFAAIVAVPPGYTTYYVSGALPKPVSPPVAGQPVNWGDTTAQT